MKFKRSSNVVFLDPQDRDKRVPKSTDKLDIVLSPSLYWVKKIKLPLSSVRAAKKLLPSIFEDTLPEGTYSYSIYKFEDEFMIFAYEDKKIIDLLTSREIPLSDVNSVRFAQSEFAELESAAHINETQSIYVKDSLVVVVPSSWLSESNPLVTQSMTLSKHSIKLQQFGHIVDNSSLYKIGAILGALVLILLVEIFIASSKRDTILESKDALFSKYRLQSTMIQNRSTLNKYSKIYKKQTKLRETIALVLSLKLKGEQKISLIEYKNAILIVSFSNTPEGSERRLLSALNTKQLKATHSFKGDTMRVEVKL